MASEFAKHNEQYAASFDQGHLAMPPSKKLLVVTCMDARVNPYESLGIQLGEAHIVRNAGGSAKDALRNIIVSQRLLGTREIAVFHHSDCGMLTFTTEGLRETVKTDSASHPKYAEIEKVVDGIDFLEISNVEESVKTDVEYLKENPLVLEGTKISGWVHYVESGKIEQVA